MRPGTIRIEFDVAGQTVTVTDDGIGFPYDTNLLGFGGTDKDTDSDWCLHGRQGVGLKALLLSTKHFHLSAVRDGKKWEAQVDGAASYLDGGAPQLEIVEPQPSPDPAGTSLFYAFEGALVSEVLNGILSAELPHVHPALAATNRQRIQIAVEHYFRAYTYAGDMNALLGLGDPKPISVAITIVANGLPTGVLPSELLTELESGRIEVTFPAKLWDVKEAVDRTMPGMPRPTVLSQALPPGGSLGRYNENFLYVGSFADEPSWNSLLENPNLRVPIEFSKYKNLFEHLRGLYIAIGSASMLSRYLVGPPRQIVAADGVPSAHVLAAPRRGAEASYVSNNIQFIANVNAKLNYGKQTIPNPRLVGTVGEFFTDAVRATLRNVAISIVGSQVVSTSGDDTDTDVGPELDVISRPQLNHGALNFKKIPRDENALIAITFELLGRGTLEGFSFYSLSQKARYDGRAVMKRSDQSSIIEPASDSDLRNIEFKLELTDLIDDFENEIKHPNEISLVIVWDDTLKPGLSDYQVVGVEYTNDADRTFHRVTKVLHCKRHNRMIQMLVISDVIAELPEGPRVQ